jgi:hypothetical protein
MPWLRSGNYYQIQEVLAVIEESDVNITDRCDLVVVPPDPDVQTDTEDIDENNLEDLDNPLQDVAGRIQLHTDNNEDVTNEGHWSEDVGDLQLKKRKKYLFLSLFRFNNIITTWEALIFTTNISLCTEFVLKANNGGGHYFVTLSMSP